MNTRSAFSVNGRDYPAPRQPAVVICIDGCEPEYIDRAIAAGAMPAMKRIIESGTSTCVRSAMPSFTNPNNLSIATGAPPAVHGICGNFFLDPESGKEIMMNDVRFLRAGTIFAAAHDAGHRVAVITAKDKLRAPLGAGLDCRSGRAWCFSSELAGDTTAPENGIDNAAAWLGRPVPNVYSAELSEFVMAAGVKLLKEQAPAFMYLSTTDYVQHKFAPSDREAIDFCAMIDRYLAELDASGAAIVATADHGMKPKHLSDGTPNAIFLQDVLDRMLGVGNSRVILPITDPYVVHHGALGSFAVIHLEPSVDVNWLVRELKRRTGIMLVLTGDEAASKFELPRDRIGDVVVVSSTGTVLGTSRERHQLDELDAPLRSHGGLTERWVPFIVNRTINLGRPEYLRNYDAFHVAARAASLES